MLKGELAIHGHPQAALLESLCARVMRHLKASDWQEILKRAWAEPIQVQRHSGTILCVQCPSWANYPNLKADIAYLARALGAYVDPLSDTAALVLLDSPDDALKLAMQLRSLATGIRFHVGMASGTCDVARILCSGRELHVLVGEVADQAAAACDVTPAGTFRMSPATFEKLNDEQASLDACMLQTEFEGEDIAAISVTPPPLKGGEQLSSFAGLGLI